VKDSVSAIFQPLNCCFPARMPVPGTTPLPNAPGLWCKYPCVDIVVEDAVMKPCV